MFVLGADTEIVVDGLIQVSGLIGQLIWWNARHFGPGGASGFAALKHILNEWGSTIIFGWFPWQRDRCLVYINSPQRPSGWARWTWNFLDHCQSFSLLRSKNSNNKITTPALKLRYQTNHQGLFKNRQIKTDMLVPQIQLYIVPEHYDKEHTLVFTHKQTYMHPYRCTYNHGFLISNAQSTTKAIKRWNTLHQITSSILICLFFFFLCTLCYLWRYLGGKWS